MKKIAITLLIVGGILLLLSGGAFVVNFLLMATSGGKIDMDEAAPFLFIEGSCCCVSVLIVAGGFAAMIYGAKAVKDKAVSGNEGNR